MGCIIWLYSAWEGGEETSYFDYNLRWVAGSSEFCYRMNELYFGVADPVPGPSWFLEFTGLTLMLWFSKELR